MKWKSTYIERANTNEKLLEADAFIRFSMSADNRVESAKMNAVSTQVTDFSFDFRNLDLKAK